jgi:hypothetical protein
MGFFVSDRSRVRPKKASWVHLAQGKYVCMGYNMTAINMGL